MTDSTARPPIDGRDDATDDECVGYAAGAVDLDPPSPAAFLANVESGGAPDPALEPDSDRDAEVRRQIRVVYPQLLAAAGRHGRDPEVAADLVQDAMLAAWPQRDHLDLSDDGFARYLMTVLRNLTTKPSPARGTVPVDELDEQADPHLSVEDTVIAGERTAALRSALADADPVGATLLVETVGHGRPIGVVAAELQMTASQAGMRRLRTQRALAQRLRHAGVAALAAFGAHLAGQQGRTRLRRFALAALSAGSMGTLVVTAAIWQTRTPAPIAITRQPQARPTARPPSGVLATVRVPRPTPSPTLRMQPILLHPTPTPAPAGASSSPTPSFAPSPTPMETASASRSPAPARPQAVCYSNSQSAVIWRDTDGSSFGTNTIPADEPSYTWQVKTNTGTWTLTQTAAQINALPRC